MSVQETKSIIGALRLRLQPLNVKEFARIFRVAEDTALKWIREGRVPAFRLGKTVRIDPHLLADMLQREVSDWEAKQELLDRRLKSIEKEGIAEDAACEDGAAPNWADMPAPLAGEREGEESQ
jgi:excisionase family DNA binding protein